MLVLLGSSEGKRIRKGFTNKKKNTTCKKRYGSSSSSLRNDKKKGLEMAGKW